MYPHTYFLVALLIGIITEKFGFISLPQAFLAAGIAVLIDLDHFFSFLSSHRPFSLRTAWRNAIGTHIAETFFHSFRGFLLFAAVKAIIFLYSSSWAITLAVAYWSHLFLDTVHILLRDAAQKRFHLSDANFAVRATIAEMIVGVFSLFMSVLYVQFT